MIRRKNNIDAKHIYKKINNLKKTGKIPVFFKSKCYKKNRNVKSV